MLKERILHYYTDLGMNCAVFVVRGANDEYGLGLDEKSIKLFVGYGGGMGLSLIHI